MKRKLEQDISIQEVNLKTAVEALVQLTGNDKVISDTVKIAIFDLDDTLVRTSDAHKSGCYETSTNLDQFIIPEGISLIKRLNEKGIKVAIATNSTNKHKLKKPFYEKLAEADAKIDAYVNISDLEADSYVQENIPEYLLLKGKKNAIMHHIRQSHSKPQSDMAAIIFDRLDLSEEQIKSAEIIMVGDSSADIEFVDSIGEDFSIDESQLLRVYINMGYSTEQHIEKARNCEPDAEVNNYRDLASEVENFFDIDLGYNKAPSTKTPPTEKENEELKLKKYHKHIITDGKIVSSSYSTKENLNPNWSNKEKTLTFYF